MCQGPPGPFPFQTFRLIFKFACPSVCPVSPFGRSRHLSLHVSASRLLVRSLFQPCGSPSQLMDSPISPIIQSRAIESTFDTSLSFTSLFRSTGKCFQPYRYIPTRLDHFSSLPFLPVRSIRAQFISVDCTFSKTRVFSVSQQFSEVQNFPIISTFVFQHSEL